MRLKLLTLLGIVVLAFGLAGCGPSKAERDAKEKARLELEEKAQRDAQAANQAITGMNKKLGRKPPSMDLGVPADPATKPADPSTDSSTQP